ncbi:hypothetical protein [Flexithrix dorotheae]|uniref:hypothetical protein n=1 Tax=Flexithrix dorotheae TaxID=70993 RepID=UPI000A07AF8D|nr:hypothetical protein [Flexithrix dorotheae]
MMHLYRYLFTCLIWATYSVGFSQVWVYDYPDTLVFTTHLGKNFRSPQYQVEIFQDGKSYDSYVMADYNTFPSHHGGRKLMTDWNHFTVFSFKGKIEIRVTKLDETPIEKCTIYPLVKEIPFQINGKELLITLDKPQKLYVEMKGMENDPLFLFADAPEENIPNKNAPEVGLVQPDMPVKKVREILLNPDLETVYFEEGIHQFGEETDAGYPGYQLPVVSNKKIYIPGGAYIVGSFRGENVSNIKICGRGIISGCGKERLAQAKSIPFNQIQLDGTGEHQIVEGLTFTNAPHFVLLSRGKITAHNLKMFAWYHQTDGFGGNEGSVIFDTFMKVNDDFVKIYRDHQQAWDMYFYKQINGALFQLGWNAYGSANHTKVHDIYVMKDAKKYPQKESNTAVVNLVNNGGSNIGNCSFENIYIDQYVQRLLGIKLKGGTIKNIHIKNVFINGGNNAFNYLYALERGKISNITLENINIGTSKISTKEAFNLKTEGEVEKVNFQ